MAVATYGTEDVSSVFLARGTVLQRPFQVFIIAADFLVVLLCYAVASFLYNDYFGWSLEQASLGPGTIVGLAFVTISYFQGVYDTHRLLRLVW